MNRVSSQENPADPFTKPLQQAKHEKHVSSMGLRHMREWQPWRAFLNLKQTFVVNFEFNVNQSSHRVKSLILVQVGD